MMCDASITSTRWGFGDLDLLFVGVALSQAMSRLQKRHKIK
jgi:hypothetical protein